MTDKPRRPVNWDFDDAPTGENTGGGSPAVPSGVVAAERSIGLACAAPGMTADKGFDSSFELLTGHPPFPWQQALYASLLRREFPSSCDIPTGLGKTSIIGIWLLALARLARECSLADYPRRLAYVVNRRTVVDQATREAERMRKALAAEPALADAVEALRSLAARPSDAPLAISTLRGQHADNAEWRDDPARPAVIVGTVDMIGSRLLFAGYGAGFKSRPLHAGFLGQDTWLIHDEAHLEPAFQELVSAVESEQRRCRELGRFRVTALTATSRGGGEAFRLSDSDREHQVVRARLEAKKGMLFHPVDGDKEIAAKVTEFALGHKDSGQAILVFFRKLANVESVVKALRKAHPHVETLTGTMRGIERDELVKKSPIFARFMPNPDPTVTPQAGTVYLVCTSAGEVGVDISADHMVCDLTPFDSMAQRLGRVNRFGGGDAHVDVVPCVMGEMDADADPTAKKAGSQAAFDRACRLTLSLMQRLPQRGDQRHDASPRALSDLPSTDRQAAFTPPPEILPVGDILFDTWALTSIRSRLPGRPAVSDWLHGIADWEPPVTQIAWRQEVELLTGAMLDQYAPADLLEDYPLKPHELLRDRTKPRVLDHLETMAKRCPDLPTWLIEPAGQVRVLTLDKLVKGVQQKRPTFQLEDSTVLLPPRAGGLNTDTGMLDGAAEFDEAGRYDVADEWRDEVGAPRRDRVWDDDDPPPGMRLVRTVDTRPVGDDGADEEPHGPRIWRWYVRPRSADDDGSRNASQPQELAPHLGAAESFADALVAALGWRDSRPVEASALLLAARWHDLGKDRESWQRSIRNRDYPKTVLAKSGGRMSPLDLSAYRHELGSLSDLSRKAEFLGLAPEAQDLVLHLVAAHHGRARPHFSAGETLDPDRTDEETAEITREVPRRFARLQRKYGRWGLAYFESLLRAADAMASQAAGTDSLGAPAPNGESSREAP